MEEGNFGGSVFSLDRFMESEVHTTPKDILQKLLESKQRGTIIGIRTPVLGRLTVLAGIQDLAFLEVPTVILKPYDAQGHMLPETKIPLDDIEAVQPFSSRFENPFITKLSDGQESLLA